MSMFPLRRYRSHTLYKLIWASVLLDEEQSLPSHGHFCDTAPKIAKLCMPSL